jgi:hypothetical protein
VAGFSNGKGTPFFCAENSIFATMNTKKQKTKPVERHTFTNEETQRLEEHQKLQTARTEVIGLISGYSASFADWSIIISEAIHDVISKKERLNLDCEKERKMLENLSLMFSKFALHSSMLSEWHEQLTLGNELSAKMIEDGHP